MTDDEQPIEIRALPKDLAARVFEKIKNIQQLWANPSKASLKAAEKLPPHLQRLASQDPVHMVMFEAGFACAVQQMAEMFSGVQEEAVRAMIAAENRRLAPGEEPGEDAQ